MKASLLLILAGVLIGGGSGDVRSRVGLAVGVRARGQRCPAKGDDDGDAEGVDDCAHQLSPNTSIVPLRSTAGCFGGLLVGGFVDRGAAGRGDTLAGCAAAGVGPGSSGAGAGV